MELVEDCEKSQSSYGDELGRRDCLCPDWRLLPQPVFLPELCHSLLLAREDAPDGRLSARLQAQLRPAHSPDAADHAADAEYPAHPRLQELLGASPLGLPPRQGVRTRGNQRHRRVQLPLGRHRRLGRELPGPGLLRLGLRRGLRTAASAWLSGTLCHGHDGCGAPGAVCEGLCPRHGLHQGASRGFWRGDVAPHRPPRELREALRRTAGAEAQDRQRHHLPGRQAQSAAQGGAVSLRRAVPADA